MICSEKQHRRAAEHRHLKIGNDKAPERGNTLKIILNRTSQGRIEVAWIGAMMLLLVMSTLGTGVFDRPRTVTICDGCVKSHDTVGADHDKVVRRIVKTETEWQWNYAAIHVVVSNISRRARRKRIWIKRDRCNRVGILAFHNHNNQKQKDCVK